MAREHGCRLIQSGRDFEFRYHGGVRSQEPGARKGFADSRLPAPGSAISALDFCSSTSEPALNLHDLPLALRAHQAANAAVALATIGELRHQGWCISVEAIRRGLADTVLPGRVEFVPGEPAVMLDVAHNPAAMRALVETLAEFPAAGRRTLVLSVSSDKDVRAIVGQLVPHFDRFVVTQFRENLRALAADELAGLVRGALELSGATGSASADSNDTGKARRTPSIAAVTVCSTPKAAWEESCRHAQPGELVCITGSFFLVAEMRSLVLNRHCNTSGN